MTDEAVQFVWEQVRLFLRGEVGRGFDIGKPNRFTALLHYVRVQDQVKLASFAEDEFRVVAAICLLGPDAADMPPPVATRASLIDITRRLEPNETKRLARVMEFAIAFGCGWHRQVRPDGEAWEQRWPDAVRALSRALEPAVMQARLWLSQHVVHYPPTNENDRFDAQMLTMHLLHPLHLERRDTLSITYQDTEALVVSTQRRSTSVPAGAKYVLTAMEKTQLVGPRKAFSIQAETPMILTVHDTEARITVHHAGQRLQLQAGQTANTVEPADLAIWACTCGNKQCAERHRMEGWNARLHSLWAFVASAVKGLPQLQTNAFIQAMYFPLLTYQVGGVARLRLVSVEYKVCQVCATEYEGDQCVVCSMPPDVRTRRRIYPRLVCVGADLPTYEREERLHCTNHACQNVYVLPDGWEGWEQVRKAKEWQRYPDRLPDVVRDQHMDVHGLQQAIATRLATLCCPLCAAPAPRRATIVWVRQFARRVEQDSHRLHSE
jgi:hypothetical protein